MRFANRHVVITGVSQGIGQALAAAYRAQGARVAGIDLTQPAKAPEVFLQGDIADRSVLERFALLVQNAFQRVDILINNAMLSRGGVDQCSYEDFLYVLRVGVAAPYYLTRLLLPRFSPGASVINLSSTRAFQSQAHTESYSAAKGGITALTHSLAVSLAGRARVNAIAPGWVDTTGA
ncbi:MAG TPA: SDR family oxidoreductase, partial [Clostridia bacterium]|nr:SDR family oxidoreductase [Clostridia bacterium]